MLCGKRKTEGPGEKFRSKDENQQQIQPTCEDRTQATALSPLHHRILVQGFLILLLCQLTTPPARKFEFISRGVFSCQQVKIDTT